MCGIAGLLKFDGPLGGSDSAGVYRMVDALAHRGPDGSGEYRDSRFLVAHRRLAVVDTSKGGQQPMGNPQGTVWVAFNGLIHNFQTLRTELLAKGHPFATRTDTEVLVHGFEEWGIEGLLARLQGMFAFVIYDRRRPEPVLILGRDRLGIKPLYYYSDPKCLLFASEVRAIQKSRLIPTVKSPQALLRFLQMGSVPEPLTTLENVWAIPAGHYASIHRGQVSLRQYWSLASILGGQDSRTQVTDAQHAELETRRRLTKSVEQHLAGDCPVGIFLSGGLDSSTLAALAVGQSDRALKTISIAFEADEADEAGFARLVAGALGTEHHEVRISSSDFSGELSRIFLSMDQPSIDGVNTYFAARAANAIGLKVILSGVGGDEIFLGYQHFKRAHFLGLIWDLAYQISGSGTLLRAAARNLARLTGRASLKRANYSSPSSRKLFYLLHRGLHDPNQVRQLLGLDGDESELLKPSLSGRIAATDKSFVDSLAIYDIENYLKNQLLKDTDSQAMAHSVETRVPFLDDQILEYVLPLPRALKLKARVNKPLLVAAMLPDLPKAVWDRPKQGFVVPLENWIRKNQQGLLSQCRDCNLFQREGLDRLWSEFSLGRVHWSQPWSTVVAANLLS